MLNEVTENSQRELIVNILTNKKEKNVILGCPESFFRFIRL